MLISLQCLNQGFVTDNNSSFEKKDKRNYLSELNKKDKELVNRIALLFRNQNEDALMKYTYIHYPYYAINSVVAERLLNKEQMEKVIAKKPSINSTTLFTIGYVAPRFVSHESSAPGEKQGEITDSYSKIAWSP